MESAVESNQPSYTSAQGKLLTLESASHYTYIQERTRPKIAITDFKSDITQDDLPGLSFLVTPSGLLDDEGSMVSGVVHPNG